MTPDNIDILSDRRGVWLRLGCIRLHCFFIVEPIDGTTVGFAFSSIRLHTWRTLRSSSAEP
jgi:hypothetical protein